MAIDPAATALFTGLIDYAGLFPPARLPMEKAFSSYLAYRAGPDAWILGRFIVPTMRLPELAPLLPSGGKIPLSVIVSGLPEISALRAFLGSFPGRVELAGLETKVPDGASPGSYAAEFVTAAHAAGLPACPTAFEVAWPADVKRHAATVVPALRRIPGAVLKIRCGGDKPAAFPTPVQLGAALAACREAGLPFKATAGLHHAIRGVRSDAGVTMHGFLNLMGGAVLAFVHRFADTRIGEMLASEDHKGFWFRAGRFGWAGYSAAADDVAKARAQFATSYGSCSFTEPVGELRHMGLVPETSA